MEPSEIRELVKRGHFVYIPTDLLLNESARVGAALSVLLSFPPDIRLDFSLFESDFGLDRFSLGHAIRKVGEYRRKKEGRRSVPVPADLVRDASLSPNAKVLMTYLIGNQDGFRVGRGAICSKTTISPTEADEAVLELVDAALCFDHGDHVEVVSLPGITLAD